MPKSGMPKVGWSVNWARSTALSCENTEGGHFGPALVCSVHPDSDANIVTLNRNVGLLPKGFLAFAPNFCGDYYCFAVKEGIALDKVMFYDHETDSVGDAEHDDLYRSILEMCDY